MMIGCVFLILFVSACSSSEKSVTTSGLTFDYQVDSSFETVRVWVEKYEFGMKQEEHILEIKADIEEKGTILLTKEAMNGRNSDSLTVSVLSESGTTTESTAEVSILEDGMMSVWSENVSEIDPTTGVHVLGSVCYLNGGSLESLSSDFYADFETNRSDLEKYDVAYIIKSEFEK